MFVERWVNSFALFTFLVGWLASDVRLPPNDIIFDVRLPPNDIIFAQLTCPMNAIILCLYQQ